MVPTLLLCPHVTEGRTGLGTTWGSRMRSKEWHSRARSNTVHNGLCPQPPIAVILPPPDVERPRNLVNKILLFAGLGMICVALLVEGAQDLFELVDFVVPHVVPERLLPRQRSAPQPNRDNHQACRRVETHIEV